MVYCGVCDKEDSYEVSSIWIFFSDAGPTSPFFLKALTILNKGINYFEYIFNGGWAVLEVLELIDWLIH